MNVLLALAAGSAVLVAGAATALTAVMARRIRNARDNQDKAMMAGAIIALSDHGMIDQLNEMTLVNLADSLEVPVCVAFEFSDQLHERSIQAGW